MITEHSAALSADLNRRLLQHLLRGDGQEDLCFAVWYPSDGASRRSANLSRPILPQPGERHVHGNASFTPAYFQRALSEARGSDGGLAFLHSHLGPGWQGMSHDDVVAEQSHAAATKAATGLPLLGLTAGTDGAWSARFWNKVGPKQYERAWCKSVRVVGDPFHVTFNDHLDPPPGFRTALTRTISAWGTDAQDTLARLRIGIVGAGSVGTIIAETLARTGIREIVLIDFDTVEEVNLDRMLHATADGASKRQAKVRSLGSGIRSSATADGFRVREIDYSIAEEKGYREALDCDILFSCVDRPWGRAVLNLLAYAYLIPVVDGGILAEVNSRARLRRADWKAHVVGPDHMCLECLGQYSPGLVQAEREGYLDDPSYIANLPADHPIRRNQNVIAFSMAVASLEVLQMLMMVIRPSNIGDVGQQSYHFVPGRMEPPSFDLCLPTCLYPGLIALGDRSGFTVYGQHAAAADARAKRAALTIETQQVEQTRGSMLRSVLSIGGLLRRRKRS